MSRRPGLRPWPTGTTWGWALALIAATTLACSAERDTSEPPAEPEQAPPALGDVPEEPAPPPEMPPPDEPPPPAVDPPPDEVEPEEEVACAIPPRMRRLNRREYVNTINDLFEGVPLPRIDIAPDPRGGLFDNDADALSPSGLLVDQYAQAALDISAVVEQHVDVLVHCDHADPWCPRDFLDDFGRRIYRRPIADAEHEFLLGLFYRWGEGDFTLGIQAIVQAMLQSPAFLYRIEDASPCKTLTPFETATRLSYALWGTTPDIELLEAAEDGELSDDRGVRWHADRLMASPRFEAVFAEFYAQWMNLERLEQTTKRPEDGFDADARASYRAEMEHFVASLFRGDGTLTELLTSRTATIDERMASIYEVPAPPPGQTRTLQLPIGREGFLNRGAFLAAHAHPFETSPILRGVFVVERLLCIELGEPPPGSQDVERPETAEGRPLTTRERTEAVTGDMPCAGCHRLINPIGFSFEYFDTLGRARYTENGQRIDGSGALPGGRPFAESVEMANLLAVDEAVSACHAQQWIRFLIGDADAADDPALIEAVTARFRAEQLSLRALITAIVTHPRFARNARGEEDDR